MLNDLLDWLLIEGSFRFRHLPAEIHYRHVARPARDVEPVGPRREHVAVWAAVRVQWLDQPRSRELSLDVESAALRVTHEPTPRFSG